jgi:hypothetical protein
VRSRKKKLLLRPMRLPKLRHLLLTRLPMPALLLSMPALLLATLLLPRAMPLRTPLPLLLLLPRKKLLRRSKPTANGLIGRADGAVHPRLPPGRSLSGTRNADHHS